MNVYQIVMWKGTVSKEIYVAANDLCDAMALAETQFSEWKVKLITIHEQSFYIAINPENEIYK